MDSRAFPRSSPRCFHERSSRPVSCIQSLRPHAHRGRTLVECVIEIGSIRRKCLDHVAISNECHFRATSFHLTWTISTEPERISRSTRFVRTRVPYNHRGVVESSQCRKSAGSTIATSGSRPDCPNYCWPLVAQRPVPHRLPIFLLMAFGSRSRDS